MRTGVVAPPRRSAAHAGRRAAGRPARGRLRRSALAWLRTDDITYREAATPTCARRETAMPGLNVPMYDPRLVQPMREELTRLGVQELRAPAAVDAALGTRKDTTPGVV